MGRRSAARSRAKGHIEELPSGGLRVSVYAGIDPVTGKRHYLREVIAPGLKAMRTAEQTRDRFLREVADKRNPRTSATID